jgi:excisionase family DNA binding protein
MNIMRNKVKKMNNQEKLTLTVEETAEKLGITRHAVYRGIERNQIPYIQVGRRYFVPVKALERLLEGDAA